LERSALINSKRKLDGRVRKTAIILLQGGRGGRLSLGREGGRHKIREFAAFGEEKKKTLNGE